jgi:hypothetical protein
MLTNSMLLERTPDLAVRFGQTSTLTQWRTASTDGASIWATPLGTPSEGLEVRRIAFATVGRRRGKSEPSSQHCESNRTPHLIL